MTAKQITQMPLRVPRSLHQLLKEVAEQEGVSLNQYCLYLLSRYSQGQGNPSVRGEDLLRFLQEAHHFQHEMHPTTSPRKLVKGNLPKPDSGKATETPRERWIRLYGTH